MFDFVNYGAEQIEFLLLIILRTSGIFLIAPILGYRTLLAALKIGLVLIILLILNTTLAGTTVPEISNEWQLAGFAAREIMIGFLIGLFFQLIFIGLQTAGAFVGYQIGFALVALFDPNNSDETSIISQFWFLFSALVFLSIDGHHVIIKSLVDSYTVLPPGAISLERQITEMSKDKSGKVQVFTVNPAIKPKMAESIQNTKQGLMMALVVELTDKITKEVRKFVEQMYSSGMVPLCICSPNIRLVLRRQLESAVSGLNIVSYNEILPETEIVSIGMVKLSDEN